MQVPDAPPPPTGTSASRLLLGILLASTVVFDGFIVAAIAWLATFGQSLVTAGDVIFVLLVAAVGLGAGLELVRLWRGGRTGVLAWVTIILGLVIPAAVLFVAAQTCCVFV